MNDLLVFDLDIGQEDARTWDMILPRFTPVKIDDSYNPQGLLDENGIGVQSQVNARQLLLVHRSSVQGRDDYVTVIRETGVPVLFVSGIPGPCALGDFPEGPNCYYRKAAVRGGADHSFERLFQRFWDRYQQCGLLDWSLVEPDSWPHELVAVYLLLKSLQLAPGRADAIRNAWYDRPCAWRESVWQAACEQFQERGGGGLDAWRGASLPGSPPAEGEEQGRTAEADQRMEKGSSTRRMIAWRKRSN